MHSYHGFPKLKVLLLAICREGDELGEASGGPAVRRAVQPQQNGPGKLPAAFDSSCRPRYCGPLLQSVPSLTGAKHLAAIINIRHGSSLADWAFAGIYPCAQP